MKKRKKGAQKRTQIVTPLPKRKAGQPTIFSAALGDEICERLSGGESLLNICRDDKMPAVRTVFKWLLADKEKSPALKKFNEEYAEAREAYSDHLFETTCEIADNAIEIAKKGKVSIANARVAALRLQLDTRKWALGRMNMKKYGDKLDLTTKGKEFKQPRPTALNYLAPAPPTTV